MTATSPRHQALRLLARREHSVLELVAKLRQKGVPRRDAEDAVAALTDSGLQSDQRFAEMLVRSRAAQGHGPIRIRADLKQQGVADDIVTLALEEADVDWTSLAATQRRKRFGEEPPSTLGEKARQHRFLAGRGFSGEQIRRALRDDDSD